MHGIGAHAIGRARGDAESARQFDVMGERCLGFLLQSIDLVVTLEELGIDHADGHEDDITEYLREEAEDVQHAMNTEPCVAADEDDRGGFFRIELGRGLIRVGGNILQRTLHFTDPLYDGTVVTANDETQADAQHRDHQCDPPAFLEFLAEHDNKNRHAKHQPHCMYRQMLLPMWVGLAMVDPEPHHAYL